MNTAAKQLYKLNEENFARRIAAKKMNLQKDREGRKLPDELWQQCLPEAQRWLQFEVTSRSPGHGHTSVSGTCPADTTVKEVEERFFHWYFGGRDAWVKDGRFGCVIHTD